MSSSSREKIALAVFAALIAFSTCVLGWYLLAGHSWNVAASNIDDTFGSMEGYTTIVYAGTQDPALVEDAEAKNALAEGAISSEGEVLEDSASSVDSALSGSAAPDVSRTTDAPTSTSTEVRASDAGAAISPEKEPVAVEDVQASYEEKGATVFALDTENPGRYEEGTILKKGTHRFGVFSVEGPQSVRVLKKKVAYFTDQKVDFVVVITADKSFVEDVEGIDIVVSTQDEDLFVMGETVGRTFYVDAPLIGNVGVLLISPSNVVSAKVIEEL